MSHHTGDEFEGLPEPVREALREAVARSATGGQEWDSSEMFGRFQAKRGELQKSVSGVAHGWRPWFYGVAAMAVIIAAVLGRIFLPEEIQFESPKVEVKQYATAAGQRANLTLADGSRVILAPASRLTISQDFNNSARAVDLDGEAYFSVTAHIGAPFVVNTGNQTTRVLGTAFSIKRYSSDNNPLQVIVAEGRVQIGSSVVGAGQGLIASQRGNIMLSDTEISAGLAWTDGRLVFVNAPVREVVTQIERWYGVRFIGVDNELASSKFSTTLQGNALTDNMLESLAIALGRRLVRRGPEILVSR